MKRKKPELKGCPFCGAQPQFRHMKEFFYAGSRWYCACVNERCKCQPGSVFRTKLLAIKTWNKRVT